jgi:stage V sporulation protein G
MNITEVRVKMVSDGTERLRAFCSVTVDDAFVIRDLKVIDGMHGPFVAMPSRKLSDRCPKCRSKNHLRARFCNDCGVKLNEERAPRDPQGRIKLHADVAHPINTPCRDQVQAAVIQAYEEELKLSKEPGYRPRGDDDHDDDFVYDDSGAFEPAGEPEPAPAASGSEDEVFGHEDLIAELKQTVGKRKGGNSRASSGFAAGIEPTEAATSPEPPQVDHDEVAAADPGESDRREEPPPASSGSNFSAGIL